MISIPSLSSSSSLSIRSLSSFSFSKPSMLSVRLFTRRRRQSHWGLYSKFSSSDPTLYTTSTLPSVSQRRQSCCGHLPSVQDLKKPTTVTSIRAMELEALIDSYPHYTLHLTLTPRLCLESF